MTDRKALAGTPDEQIRLLLQKITDAGNSGVDWIQIREKDLPGRALTELVREAIPRVPETCRILVNDRLDVACTTGAAGVHLGGQSLPVPEVRRFLREQQIKNDFLVGSSSHSLEEAKAAEDAGADYVFFGPIYATPSKVAFGEPQGVERLAGVSRRLRIPVIAIGGIAAKNAHECTEAGASGVAAIRLFQDTSDGKSLSRDLLTG